MSNWSVQLEKVILVLIQGRDEPGTMPFQLEDLLLADPCDKFRNNPQCILHFHFLTLLLSYSVPQVLERVTCVECEATALTLTFMHKDQAVLRRRCLC